MQEIQETQETQETSYTIEFVCANEDCRKPSSITLETTSGGKRVDPGCFAVVICEECVQKEKEASKKHHIEQKKFQRLEASGFPLDKVAAWSFSDGKRNTALEDWIKEHRDDALWISGFSQIGKTFAMIKVAREEVERGKLVRWVAGGVLIGGYVDAVRDSSAAGSAYIRRFLNCDLLIIDDLDDPGQFSYTAGQLIYKLLDGIKNDRSKQIWITVNLLKGELQKMFKSNNHAVKVEQRLKDRFCIWKG
jgi:DNA replication protein DnaC